MLEVIDHSVSQERFHLVDCSACGFRFTNPRPASNELGRYYQSADYISHTNAAHSLRDRVYQRVRRFALAQKCRLVSRYEPYGHVLDVGCGTGEFLAFLKSCGYLAHGVEPNLKAREMAIATHALKIVPDLDAVRRAEGFRVITLWHVLEHLPGLHVTLKKLFSLLADGGLLIIAVPDRSSWDASHYGADWAAWDVPRHVSHFRQQDIKRLLHEHGFELDSIKRMWFDAPYVAMLSEGIRGKGQRTALVIGGLVGMWSNLVALISGRPASSSLYIARKGKA
ncbi:MAG: class I SAM-dependent methyltransferase [Flavobacteriales bacterium]|nr:class I SAM-dependent methyltransferase [Flavobacteriales bacterium]